MFYNNLKFAIRSLLKNKIYTAINLFGLAIGIAATLLIFRMVNYELSFNKGFKNYGRIVRVVTTSISKEQGKTHGTCTPIPAMKEIENTVSQFEETSRMREMWASITIPNPNGGAPLKKFGMPSKTTAFFTETSFFKIFDFKWILGDPTTALDEPGSIVLTKTWAEKCFDNIDQAIGSTLLIDNITSVVVKGVLEDLPTNCDFNFPFLISYKTVEANADLFFYNNNDSWGSCSSNDQVYALLQNPNQWDAANASIKKVGEKEYAERNEKRGRQHFHNLQAVSDLHYNEDLSNSGSHTISKTRIKVLGFIGLLILIMACFNFINLTTAQSMLRAKEIGVRKTLGSTKTQLIGQLMSETSLIVLGAVIIGMNLALFASPLLKYISDVPNELPFLLDPKVIGFLGVLAIVVTLLSGLYPSISLSNYSPLKALNNETSGAAFGGASVRKALVVLQFMIAQGLIIGAMITINQMDYIQSRDLGFNKDLVYTFSFNSDSTTLARQVALKQNLLQIPEVESVSLNSDEPLSGNTWSSNWRYGSHAEDEAFSITRKFGDENYQETFGIELLAGKWYPPSDTSRHAVINMITLTKIGINDPQLAIGEKLRVGGLDLKIVGVTKDFHTHSFRRAHEPLVMSTYKQFYWNAGVKIRSSNIKGTIAEIKNAYDRVLPEQVFEGTFLDEAIAQHYEDDQRLSATCKGFGFLAILISCLGLFGLATHAAAQRIKEIGIRKVLGAGVSNIVLLLSKDFLKLVVIALFIAAPLAWFIMNKWLDNFVFRIDIDWKVILITGLLAIFIAFITVSWQAIRAAIANPIKSLRNE